MITNVDLLQCLEVQQYDKVCKLVHVWGYLQSPAHINGPNFLRYLHTVSPNDSLVILL